VVERAIKQASENVGIGPKWDNRGNALEIKNWMTYWDPSDGVRTLRLISENEYPTSYEEDDLREFTFSHWQFFYTTSRKDEPRRAYIDVLWAKIHEFLDIWRQTKATDYWAAGMAMREALLAARLAPPDWPPKTKPTQKTAADTLDDDIPF
jgi:hypothetical protein